MPGETSQLIRNHIESFPVKEAHCSSRVLKYLDARLDVRQMHELFQEKHPSANVSYKCYLKFFKENFSLAFGKPHIDTRSACDQLGQKLESHHLNDNAKRAVAGKLMEHRRRSKKFCTAMKNVKGKCSNNDDVKGLTFGYMQNVTLPDHDYTELIVGSNNMRKFTAKEVKFDEAFDFKHFLAPVL
jgi:hypothetical protein